jgi:hypothetical protein
LRRDSLGAAGKLAKGFFVVSEIRVSDKNFVSGIPLHSYEMRLIERRQDALNESLLLRKIPFALKN